MTAPGTNGTLVTVDSIAPSNQIDVQLSVLYWSSSSSSTSYELEARVFDTSGQPIVGERVDFTTSRGSLSDAWSATSVVGIADTILTVPSSGDVTVTASARGVQAASTFYAQVGGGGSAPMTPTQTLGITTEIYGLAYTPDCSSLIAADENGNVRAWNTSDWSVRWTTDINDNRAYQVSVSPNGQNVLVAYDDGVEILNTANGQSVCTAGVASGDEAVNAVFTSDSTFVRTGNGSSTIDPTMYRHSSLCQSNGSSIFVPTNDDAWSDYAHLDYSLDKDWVAVISDEAILYVRNATSGASVFEETMSSGSSRGHDTDFNSNGSRVLALGYGTVKYFNTSTWTFTTYSAPSLGGNGYFGAKLIDNDSKFAISGAGKLEVIDLSGGATLRTADINGDGTEIDWCQSRAELAAATRGGSVHIFRPLDAPDSQGPVISVTTPPSSFVTSDPDIHTEGRVTDASGISTFTINGASVALDAQGFFATSVSLNPGANTLTYRAVDALSNESTVDRTGTRLIDSTPPVISGATVSPSIGSSQSPFVLQVSVVDGDTGVASVTAKVKTSGGTPIATLPMSSLGVGLYQATQPSGLAEGLYVIDIEAVDSSPQQNSASVGGAASFQVQGCDIVMSNETVANDRTIESCNSIAVRESTVTGSGHLSLRASKVSFSDFRLIAGGRLDVGATSSPPVVLQDTSRWPFDEGAGTLAEDTEGNADGTVSGAVWTDGHSGFGLAFGTPSTSAVAIPKSTFSALGNRVFAEVWIFPEELPTTGTVGTVLRKRGAYNDWGIEFRTDGVVRTFIAGYTGTGGVNGWEGISVDSPNPIALNEWTRVSSRYDGTTLQLLVNDVVVASDSKALSLQWNTPTCPADDYYEDGCYYGAWIGSTSTYSRTSVSSSYTFHGKIDDLRIGVIP